MIARCWAGGGSWCRTQPAAGARADQLADELGAGKEDVEDQAPAEVGVSRFSCNEVEPDPTTVQVAARAQLALLSTMVSTVALGLWVRPWMKPWW
jgi:hypothetical protein